jgi:hypothetical protein
MTRRGLLALLCAAPAAPRVVTAGMDVQQNRVVYTIQALDGASLKAHLASGLFGNPKEMRARQIERALTESRYRNPFGVSA